MVVAVELLDEVTRTVGIVRAVPDLALAPLEAAGERDVRRRGDRVSDERLGRLACAADPDLAAGERDAANVSSGRTTIASVGATASFSRRDRLERVAEDVRVLEPDVREEDDARAEDVRRVEAAAEPCLDDRDVDLGVGEGRRARRR